MYIPATAPHFADVITLTLLHANKDIPVQNWSFENEPVIRIGRATDNHVVLYSAVVSRHHVELRYIDSQWALVNLGTNGTYVDGKRVDQLPVSDGMTIRLARSGPNIQIRLGPKALEPLSLSKEQTVTEKTSKKVSYDSDGEDTAAHLTSIPQQDS